MTNQYRMRPEVTVEAMFYNHGSDGKAIAEWSSGTRMMQSRTSGYGKEELTEFVWVRWNNKKNEVSVFQGQWLIRYPDGSYSAMENELFMACYAYVHPRALQGFENKL